VKIYKNGQRNKYAEARWHGAEQFEGTANDQGGSLGFTLAWRFSFDLAGFQAREANSYNQDCL